LVDVEITVSVSCASFSVAFLVFLGSRLLDQSDLVVDDG
jgi:hypothetical protein